MFLCWKHKCRKLNTFVCIYNLDYYYFKIMIGASFVFNKINLCKFYNFVLRNIATECMYLFMITFVIYIGRNINYYCLQT